MSVCVCVCVCAGVNVAEKSGARAVDRLLRVSMTIGRSERCV